MTRSWSLKARTTESGTERCRPAIGGGSSPMKTRAPRWRPSRASRLMALALAGETPRRRSRAGRWSRAAAATPGSANWRAAPPGAAGRARHVRRSRPALVTAIVGGLRAIAGLQPVLELSGEEAAGTMTNGTVPRPPSGAGDFALGHAVAEGQEPGGGERRGRRRRQAATGRRSACRRRARWASNSVSSQPAVTSRPATSATAPARLRTTGRSSARPSPPPDRPATACPGGWAHDHRRDGEASWRRL